MLTARDVITVALTSSVVSTLITAGFQWFRESRTESQRLDRDARYLALRLATTFERFALDCAATIAVDEDDQRAGRGPTSLPKMGPLPSDADWKALDPELAARSMSITNEIALSALSIETSFDVLGGDAIEVLDEQAGKNGYRALLLAGALRSKHGLPGQELGKGYWEFAEVLKQYHDHAESGRPVVPPPSPIPPPMSTPT